MLDLYVAEAFASDATDPRNLFHQRALHEARIASEYRELAASQPRPIGRFARLRAALTGARDGAPVQACSCPA